MSGNKYDYYGNILDTNPYARKFLDAISIMEGTSTFSNPYLAQGGTRGQLLTTGYDNHPMAYGQGKWNFKLNDGRQALSTANGKYAFIYPTWKELQRTLGPQLKFDPRSQDIAALHLIAQRGQLQNLMNGNLQPVIQKVGHVWASLPTAPDSYNQFRHGWNKMGQALKTVGLDPMKAGLDGNYQPIKGYNANPNTQLGANGQPITGVYNGNVAVNGPSMGSSWQHTPSGGAGPTQSQDVLMQMGGGQAATPYTGGAPNSYDSEMDRAIQQSMNQYFANRKKQMSEIRGF